MRFKDYEFSHVIIGGITFTASIGCEGPTLKATVARRVLGDVRIDAGCILELEDGWSLCKYDYRQVRMHLSQFSPQDIEKLADHFGFPFGPPYGLMERKGLILPETGMFQDLCDWVDANPIRAKRIKPSEPFMGEWYTQVIEARDAAPAPSM